MTVMSPLAILIGPPETGASSMSRPSSPSEALMARESPAAIVADTMTGVPGFSCVAMPFSPNRAWRH